MQKFLRTLALVAFLMVPWVTQAQQTLTVADGTETNEYVPFYGYYADESQHNQVLYPAADLTAMVGKSITQMVFYVSSYNYNYDWGTWTVSLGETSATSLSGIDNATTLTQVFTGAFETYLTSTTLTITFADSYTYNGGNLLLDINHPAGSYSQCYFYGIEATGASYCYDASRNFLPKTTFTYETPSSCTKPGAIVLGETTGTSAAISWTAGGNETSWNVYLNGVLTSDSPVSTPAYNFTGLEGLTTYNVAVEAICGNDVSSQRTASFTTLVYCANGSCDLSVYRTDSYDDSWNGCLINIMQNGNLVSSIDCPSGYSGSTATYTVCKGTPVTLTFTKGSYPGELGGTISDGAGDVVFTIENMSSYNTGDVIATISEPCPSCFKPTALTASDETVSGATLTWTRDTRNEAGETYTIYNVTDDVVYQTGVTGTSITLTGLNENTNYEFTVTTTCSATDNASALSVTFTTLANCPAPTNLAASDVTAHTADITWTGNASSYNVRYQVSSDVTEGFETGSLPAGWTKEGDGTWSVGTGDNNSTTGAHSGSYNAKITHGTTGNVTYLVMPAMNLAGAAEASLNMWYVNRSWSGDIDGFGVCYRVNGGDWNELFTTTAAHSTWTELNINLTGLADNYQIGFRMTDSYGYGVAIDDIVVVVPNDDWTSATATTNSYALQNLSAETTYKAQVQAVCASSQSAWSDAVSFTTDIACPVPTALTASNPTTNSVELSWTENGAATAWQICVNGDESNLVAATTNPFTLTGLTDATDYTVKVRANCGGIDGVSEWSNTESFTTVANCQVPDFAASNISNVAGFSANVAWNAANGNQSYILSYRTQEYFNGVNEQFGSTAAPSEWMRSNTLLSDALNGTPLAAYTGGWSFGASNGVFDNHAKVNIYGTSCKYWLVTPSFTVSDNPVLTFDLALTAYSGTLGAPSTAGTDDKFVVLITTNNMATWTILRQWDNAGSEYVYNNINSTATGEAVSINLSAYAGQNVKIAFYGESTTSNADNYLHVDNVLVGAAVAAGNWQTVATTETSAPLTDLVPLTPYEVKLQALCANNAQSDESNVVTFSTLEACPDITYVGFSEITPNSMTIEWTDDINTGATYTIYNMANQSVVASGLTSMTYTVNNLESNTAYAFGVEANCNADYSSNILVVSGRTACEAMSLPWTCGFEADEIRTTTNSEATPALPWCSWRYFTPSATSGRTYPYSYSSTTYAHEGSRSLYYYGITTTTYPEVMAFILPQIDVASFPMNGNRVTFYARMGAASNSKAVKAYTLTDPTDWSTATYVGEVTVSGATIEKYTIVLTNAAANEAYLALAVERGTGSLYLDDLTLEVVPSCLDVTDVTAAEVTGSTVTLTWTDADNNGATYTIYNMADESVVASNVAATTYTVQNLESNTAYTFGVQANCSNGDSPIATVNARTACTAMSLPWTCGFEADEIQTTSNSEATPALPWCSWRYFTPSATSGRTYPYSYSSTTYAHNSSRCLYYYGTTSTSYPEVMAFILPQVDVASFPMNGNRVRFWARSSSASYNKTVKVYTLTDPTDWNTATYVDEVVVSGTTHEEYMILLNNATPTAAYLALAVERGSGSLYLDDLTLDLKPRMITNLAATDITANSVTLTWEDVDADNNTTYTVSYGNSSESNVTGTSYTVSGLAANTSYTFTVMPNSPSAEASTVTAITKQNPAALPYVTGFETGDDNSQWTVINDATNGWYFGSAAGNDGNGLYISNDGGNSNAYTVSGIQWSYAYRTLNLAEAGWYQVALDWMAYGEGNYDYLRVWLAPADINLVANKNPEQSSVSVNAYRTVTPAGWIDLAGGKLNVQSSWQNMANLFEVAAAGQYNLVLMWANDGSGGTQPPAVVDNIVFKAKKAFEPVNLTATNITATNAMLTWTRDERNNNTETYTVMNGDVAVVENVNNTNCQVPVIPNADNTFTVVAMNGNETSEAKAVTLRVNEYPTEAGKMVNLTYSYNFSDYNAPEVNFYYGMGNTRAAQAAETRTSTSANGLTFANTTSANWPVDGPVTVTFLNHNATPVNFSSCEVSYVCPSVVVDNEPVTVEANGTYTWTPEPNIANHATYTRNNHATTADATDLVETINDVVLNAGNCDSVYHHMALTVHPDYTIDTDMVICERESVTIGNETFSATGNYTVTLQSATGADSVINLHLQVNAAPIAYIYYNNRSVTSVAAYCDNADMEISARANITNVTYMWDDQSSDVNRTVNPSGTSTYTLVATDASTGCTSLPVELTVATTPVPVLTIAGDEAICYGANTTLTVSDSNNVDASYRWSTGATGNSITVNPVETTIYTVTATTNNSSACTATAEFTVTVNALPVVEVSTSVDALCAGSELTLNATSVDGYSYSWNSGATTAQATVNPTVSGAYTLTVTDQNECVNEFTTANVTVYPVYNINDQQTVCYTQNPYTWGTQTLTADGNYSQTFQTVNQCDSTVNLTFSFEQMSQQNSYREVCQGTEVTWGEETIVASEDTTLSYIDNSGDCPAQFNLILTVNPTKASSFEQVACDSYNWNVSGETYTQSGAYDYTLATTKGCDSVVTMNLTVNYQNTGIDVQTACDKFVWNLNGVTYTESTNEPVFTLAAANAYGCDSVVTLNLTVNNSTSGVDFHRVCDAKTFTWLDGDTYSLSVEPTDNITFTLDEPNAVGCDSVAVLHLVMNYVNDTLNWTSVTACDEYVIDTVACDGTVAPMYIRESGDYEMRTHNATTGRDQISRIHLTLTTSSYHTNIVSACVPYTWQIVVGQDATTGEPLYETVGTYNPVANDTVVSYAVESNNCNVIEVLRLHALRPSEVVTEVALCQNGSWTDGNNVEYVAANYELGENEPIVWNQATNADGCDSIDKVVFTVNPVYNVNAELTYCESEFENNTLVYANPNNAEQTIELTIPGELDQTAYTNSVVANWSTANGCDSVVTINYTVNPITYDTVEQQSCYTYHWDLNGEDYDEDANVTFKDPQANQYGCENYVTLNLTITDSLLTYDTIEVCTSYQGPDGVTYRETKTFREALTSTVNSCDSIHYTTYHVNQRALTELNIVTNMPYDFGGKTYTASQSNIQIVTTSDAGCDSLVVLNLTMVEPLTICEGQLPYESEYDFTLPVNAVSGIYTTDDEDTIIAYTVNMNVQNTVEQTACDSYTWEATGLTYNESTVEKKVYTAGAANGCDSIVTLNLTINESTTAEDTVTICDTYTWTNGNGQTYTTSGDYTWNTTNAENCPLVVTLHLTVNKNEGSTETLAVCDSVRWNETLYTESGTYTYNYSDDNQCVGTATLNLTVNPTVYASKSITINEASYIFDEVLYTAPADETFEKTVSGVAAGGCDSVYTIHLTVMQGDIVEDVINECGTYTWINGHTYGWIAANEAPDPTFKYKDLTDDSYIFENPTFDTVENGVMYTHVLWLTLAEASITDSTIARFPLSQQTLTLGDAEHGTHTLDFSAYTADATLDTALRFTDPTGYYCEVIVNYHINLVWNYDEADTEYVCYDVDSYTWNNTAHALTVGDNTFTETFNAGTADEQVTTKTVVRRPQVVVVASPETACDSYTWTEANMVINTTGNYEYTFTDVNGCDSLVTMAVTINASNTSVDVQEACDTYTWQNGITYTASNNTDTVVKTNAAGCDSIVTLNLTIKNSVATALTDGICLGVNYSANDFEIAATELTSGTHTYTKDNLTAANGCDSTVTLTLTVSEIIANAFTAEACDTYTWNRSDNSSEEKTASGTFRYDYTTAQGCNGYDSLYLTINNSYTKDSTIVYYGGSLRLEGVLYEAPITDSLVVFQGETTNGCDSIINYHLTVLQYTSEMDNIVACGEYTWARNNHTYQYISSAESEANNGALYKDITNPSNVTYVYTLPSVTETPNTYFLNLTLNEAYFGAVDTTVPLSIAELTIDTNHFDYSQYKANKQTPTFTETLRLHSDYYCDSIITYTIHLVNNYDTTEATVCSDVVEYTNGNKTWPMAEMGTTYWFYDTVDQATVNEFVHCYKVFRRSTTPVSNDVVACDSYVWTAANDTVILTSGSYTHHFLDANQCDYVEVLNVTINNNSGTAYTETACDSYTWHSIERTETGDYYYEYTDANTCASVDTLHLTINKNSGHNTEVTVCVSYTWVENNNTEYTNSGVYNRTYNDVNGCASVDTLTLTINPITYKDSVIWTSEGSYRFNGEMLMATGVYHRQIVHTGENQYGCDSVERFEIHVGNANYAVIDTISCSSFTWIDGNTYVWISDEDAAANMNESQVPALYKNETTGAYVYYNPTYSVPQVGDYDSIYMLRLTLTQNTTSSDVVTFYVSNQVLNYGDSTFDFTTENTTAYNNEGFTGTTVVSEVHFANPRYCDSIVTLTINVVNNYSEVETADICATETSYTWRNHTVSTATNDFDHMHTYRVYDTVGTAEAPVIEFITINQHPFSYATERRTACDTYTWNGLTFTESTSGATVVLEDQFGCDSTVTLVLTINKNTSTSTEATACGSYNWTTTDGFEQVLNESGVYTHDYNTPAGCPSTDTLNLTINQHVAVAIDTTVCNSLSWAGSNYTTSGTYTKTFTAENTCDSTVTMNLTVNTNTFSTEPDVVACGSYEWFGTVYTASATNLEYHTENVNGCDSTIFLNNLTINPVYDLTENMTVCDSYIWNGQTYTESGEYTFEGTTTKGCDSTVTLNLTVNTSTHNVETTVMCGSYTWATNGETYTESGDYTYSYTNNANCPSVDTLHLTIGDGRTFSIQNVKVCGSYDWVVNGELVETFTESTETSTDFVNPNTGCDSIVYLNLVIFPTYDVELTDVVCLGSGYTKNGFDIAAEEIAEPGEYVFTLNLTSEYDCDSTVTLKLTVDKVVTNTFTEVACDKYEWNAGDGETYVFTESGVYFSEMYTNAEGCANVDTLNLTINVNSNTAYTYAACDTYTWNGVEYNETGDYTYDYTNDLGCASTDTLHLTISNSENNTITETVCDSYTWTNGDGETYTESGEYTYNYSTDDGCTGKSILVLTVNKSTSGVETATACDNYDWNNETYTANGVYTFETVNAAGCDSIVTLNLTINNSTVGEETATACNFYEWKGNAYLQSGDYTFDTVNAIGCDSTVTLHLTINTPVSEAIDTVVCAVFEWDGATYEQSGEYTRMYTAANGCDSIVTVNLTVNNVVNTVVTATACDSYLWENGDGVAYTESGDYTATFENAAANGCDSIVTLTLTINNSIAYVDEQTACDTYTWINGVTYTASNDTATYVIEGVAANGCDSIATLNLTINNSSTGVDVQTACSSFEWIDGNVYTESNNTATFTLTNAAGCDSVVTLNLTVNNAVATEVEATACGSYEWNNNVYDQSGVYTYTTEAANGCDSVVTLTLTINQPTTATVSQTACGSYEWNGTTYTESGFYTYNTQNANGCDSTVTLILTVKSPVSSSLTAVACDSYNWNNTDYTVSGDYTVTFENAAANGCDSIVTLHLTINSAVATNVEASACDSYVWNGQTYSESGVYTYNGYTTTGCDSTVTLTLTISNTVNVNVEAAACGSYTWNGQTYTESGVYTYNTTTTTGCDSTTTLTLTINNAVATAEEVTACGSYTWNGQTYSQSGVYTYTTEAANGCDSTVTLTLTISDVVTTAEEATACGSYTWNGQTYTESGVYTYTTEAVNGCDSTVTLTLTISNATVDSIEVAACDNYEWNDSIYTESGVYTYTASAATGCDSTVVLTLTINQSVDTAITVTAVDSYEWNDSVYTESGVYTYTGTAANGCDSTVTLYLTITTAQQNTLTLVTSVNGSFMGSVNPEPGTYIYQLGDTVNMSATAFEGFQFTGWHITVSDVMQEVVLDTTIETSFSSFSQVVTDTMLGFTVNAMAMFAVDSNQQPSVWTVTLSSADETMGTVSPAGVSQVADGSNFTATATPNEGYIFSAWMTGNTVVSNEPVLTFMVLTNVSLVAVFMPDTTQPVLSYHVSGVANDTSMGYVSGSGMYEDGSVATLTAHAYEGYHFVRWSTGDTTATINLIVSGEDISLIAYFEANTGIDDVDMNDVTIYSTDSKIVVNGAEGNAVYVFDVNGRLINSTNNATEIVEFRMASTGVYLVKVGNAPAKRVLVVR